MNSLKSLAMPVLHMLWRQKWLAIGVAWLVCAVGWIGVALIPPKYESSTRIYLNADPLLVPLLQGLAVDTNPTRHLEFLQRTLISRPNLEELVRMTDLGVGVMTPAAKEELYKHLAAGIDIQPITANLMTISYRSKDPQIARNVVQALLTIFAEKVAGSSRSEMDSAQRFLDDEIAAYRDQLRAAEKRRAELARQYPDIVSDRPPDAPDGGGDARGWLEQARATVVRTKNELADATTARNSLRQQIASVPPLLSVDRAPQVIINSGRPLNPDEARLEQMRGNLDTLRLKYTDQHPDVVAAREEIRQLEGEIKHSASAVGASAAKMEVPNTIYDQLKVKLVEAEGQVATAQRRLDEAQAEQSRIEKIAQSAPTILSTAEDLDRDYGVVKKNYEELVARRESALIASAADTKTEKIQFRIIDPPQVPLVPAEPKRPLLVSLVLLAGLGAGVATPILMAQLDRSFTTITQLRELGIPVLGSVTRLSLGPMRRRAAIQLVGVCASAAVLIGVYGTLLALSLGLRATTGVS